jgi:hypothetical protein
MKNIKILPAGLLAAAAFASLTPQVRAQSTVSTKPGDLVLGFQLSGDNDLEVDLGSASTFLSDTSVTPLTFGVIPVGQTGAGSTVTSLNADLTANYGGSWASSTSLLWGAAGAISTSSSYDVFFTRDSSLSGFPNPGNSGASEDASPINSLVTGLGGLESTNNSTVTASLSSSATDAWSTFDPGTTAFSTAYDIENTNGTTAVADSLTLWELVPSGRNPNGSTATDVGSFALNNSGDLTFTPASVPEPSTWASIIVGALSLVFFRRRGNLRVS